MKYSRFEDLPVWKDGVRLAVSVFELTQDGRFRYKGDIANQLQRAALSITNNIAEGFERGTTRDLINFLYYARGSAGEVRSILAVMSQMSAFDHSKPAIADLRCAAEAVSRQISGWTGSLQNTPITGQRYQNDTTRKIAEREKDRTEFLAMLRSRVPVPFRDPGVGADAQERPK